MDGQMPMAKLDASDLLYRVASVTRLLRDSMRELGLDQAIRDAACAIPDTRDRLRYIAQMTERAADRTLSAAEGAQPLQDGMSRGALALNVRWQQWLDNPLELPEASELVADTRSYLGSVSQHTAATQAKLLDIIMAQDFQDLTGQVITKMMDVIGTIESELLQVLLDSVSADKRKEANSLLNGPQVNPQGRADVVTSQNQVDDLLASLGF